MQFLTSIHAYDTLDQVAWNLVVLRYEDYEYNEHDEAIRLSGILPGLGDDNPEAWLAALLDDISHKL